ncbi:hypothetical protein GCM10022237_24510 [Nocardioides ginsengisoli]
MAQVVEADAGEVGGRAGGPPPPVDGVVVHRLVSDGEQPVLRGALRDVVADVTGEDAHELVGQVDGSF